MGIKLPGWQPREWTAPLQTWTLAYDVIVVGGGLSGCAAALAAARRGARVVVLEPTHMVGGQFSVGGVGACDLVPGMGQTVEQGLWGEFADLIRAYYRGYGISTAVVRYRQIDSMGANAPVVDRILSELLYAAGVEVLRNVTPSAASVTSSGAAVTTPAGTITGSVAIDATEDGSLLALADFPHRLGNIKGRGTTVYGEPAQIQHITQTAVIRRYDRGVPLGLQFLVTPPGYAEHRPRIVNGYPQKPNKPAGSGGPNDFAGYRGYPDIADLVNYTAIDLDQIRRTSLNHLNDIEVTTEYLTDPAYKQKKITDAKNRTLGIIFYLQRELGLKWGVAQDEGFRDGPNAIDPTFGQPGWVADFPTSVYLRESRRLIGKSTLTGARIYRKDSSGTPTRWATDTLAVGTYPSDMHGSRGPEDFESDLGESDVYFKATGWGPFIIPFGSFVPADSRRLVVAEKNLSQSRIASSATRVHTSVTAIGEAAGTIAALAWKTGAAPSAVSSRAVQVSLLKRGALLLPFPISGVPAGSADYAAVSLALLHNKVAYKVDVPGRRVVLTSSQLASAKEIGRGLVASWKGPV